MPEQNINSLREFAAMPDLYDDEIKKIGQIVALLTTKYGPLPNTVRNLDRLRDEAVTRLGEIGIVAQVDPSPALEGKPPIIDIIGKTSDDPIYKTGFDHSRKQFEVKESVKRNEAFKGQKERTPRSKKK